MQNSRQTHVYVAIPSTNPPSLWVLFNREGYTLAEIERWLNRSLDSYYVELQETGDRDTTLRNLHECERLLGKLHELRRLLEGCQ